MLLRRLGIVLLLGGCQPALSQQLSADSSLRVAALRSLSQHYARALGSQSRLYNGPEYVDYVRRNTQGHRFFASAETQPATITYAGHTYADVPLLYDLVHGLLVLAAPGGGLHLQLLNEQVARFTLDGHSFIRLVADSSGDAPLRTGFYDLLVDGPVQLLAAHHKKLTVRTSAGSVESEITASNEYFVRKNHRYYRVDKAATILRLFPENKLALRDYIKNNRLEFGPDRRELALEALVRYQATLAAPPAN